MRYFQNYKTGEIYGNEFEAADPFDNEIFGYIERPIEHLSRLAFLNRFTNEELVTIYSVAKSNVQLEVMLDKLKAAEYINVGDAEVCAGINMLEQAGLIAAGRSAEILKG